jgi:DNA-binding NtrC family response regulator
MTQAPTVLVVDDEFLLRACAADFLEEAGYQVLQAGCREEAISVLTSASQVDALFTDVDMNRKGEGLVLAWEVARRWPHIRIVVTSGNHAISHGDMPAKSQFIPKPYDIKRVIGSVESVH